MNENFELLEHIYKDSEMACFTLSDLLDKLKDKDNKIKGVVEDILHEYEDFLETCKKELEGHDITPISTSKMAKKGASMGIKKEVKCDNSDSSIADMLIQGIAMGSIDMEKRIKNYDKEVDKSNLRLAKDFLKFQEKSIDKLKKYL